MIQYTLRQAGYFVAAAEHGSIAEAARALNVSQPSISAAVAKLEETFAVQLFIRHHAQGVSLTPAGQRLVAEMRALLAHAQEVHQSAARIGDEITGDFDVGCFVTVAPFYMPRLMSAFRAAYPNARLRMHEGMQDDLVAGLESGRFEVAVMYEVDLKPTIEADLLAEFPPYVLLGEDHPLAGKAVIALEDLVDEPMVLLDMLPSSAYFTTIFISAGFQPNVAHRSPSFETVRSLVANGFGFSLLVTRPAADLSYDGLPLVARPIADDVPQGRIVLGRVAQTRPTRLAQAFSTVCKNHFAALRDRPAGAPGAA